MSNWCWMDRILFQKIVRGMCKLDGDTRVTLEMPAGSTIQATLFRLYTSVYKCLMPMNVDFASNGTVS